MLSFVNNLGSSSSSSSSELSLLMLVPLDGFFFSIFFLPLPTEDGAWVSSRQLLGRNAMRLHSLD
jgi:hypothetical protein